MADRPMPVLVMTTPAGPPAQEPLWRHLVGDRMRSLRHERGETLGDVARRAGVSPQYLSEMERGSKDPSSEMVAAVAGALGWSLLDLTRSVAEQLDPQRSTRSSGSVPAEPTRDEPTRRASAGSASAVGASGGVVAIAYGLAA